MQNQEVQLKRLAECLGEASNLVSNLAKTSNVAADGGNDNKHDDDTRPRSSGGFSLGQSGIYSSSSLMSNRQQPQITASNHSLSSRSTFSNLGHLVNHAQGMMEQASNNGLFRRLSQSERLRVASQFRSGSHPISTVFSNKKAKKVKLKSQDCQFVLVSFGSDEESFTGKNF